METEGWGWTAGLDGRSCFSLLSGIPRPGPALLVCLLPTLYPTIPPTHRSQSFLLQALPFSPNVCSAWQCVKMCWEVDSGVPNSAQAAPSALCTPLGRCPVLPYFTDLRGFWTASSSLWSPARCWEQQPHRPADRQETTAGWLVSPAIPTFPTLPSKTLHLSGHIFLSGLRTRPGCFQNC